MSGTTRRANGDGLPVLTPSSEPPASVSSEVEEASGRREPPLAPRGLTEDPSFGTLPDAMVLNNKFRVLRQLCAREHEIVYQSLHTGTGRKVQLHMLPSGLTADSPAAERLLRAARASGRVPHPNVLSVVDSGTDHEGRPFVVYEDFAGVGCDVLVHRYGPYSARLGAEIMCQVLDGLQALHARGVLHRHIRPENVLIERGEGPLRVKLTGFAYGVVSGKSSSIPELPKGYSRYLAPEARRGLATSTPGVDIYAAGVLMRFLLTGQADPNVDTDPIAARAITRATEEDPDERFTSAEHFLAAVGLMVHDDEPESAEPTDALAADLKYMQQRRERESGVSVSPTGVGRMELFPVLMMIEAVYARIGGEGWRRLIAEVPEAEQVLPAAGRGEHFRQKGVPVALVGRLLATSDAIGGKGDLSWLPQIGEALVKRGLVRFCPQLPKVLTPDVLVACTPVIWASLSRQGEVVLIEHLSSSARIGIRAQVEPCLEVCAVVAGMLRAQLRALARRADVNTIASQALGDAADIFVLTWG